MPKKTWKLSASFIAAFKACPVRCRLSYVIGLRPEKDSDVLRIGSHWHRILEIIKMKPGKVCPDCGNLGQKNPDCPLCRGTDILPEDMMTAVSDYLTAAYSDRPTWKTHEEWETERIKLLYSLVAYIWYWEEDDAKIEVLELEKSFTIPLRNPDTCRALPHVKVVGKIDKVIRKLVKPFVMEHKSTSKSVDPDSSYWNRMIMDTQTTLYPFAARQLSEDYKDIQVLYDVWHKPTISPKMLTQGDSKKFVADGKYYGTQFLVGYEEHSSPNGNPFCSVNGVESEVKPGAKDNTFAIRETPEMYGARLLQDITERPEFYFARKEIPRTEADLKVFEVELYNIYQTVKNMNKNGGWYHDESQCEATFKCSYTDLCYNNVELSDGMEYEGFKNIFKEKKDAEERRLSLGDKEEK